MPYPVLRDADIDLHAHMPLAVAAVERALAARRAGGFIAPPRHAVPFGERGGLVFTTGGVVAGPVGFRAYETFPGMGPGRGQVVAVWDGVTGALKGLVVGNRLGPLRTGAIGAVALRRLARADASRVGLIGAGEQAATQLLGAAAVRPLAQVRVFSRAPEARAAFCAAMEDRLGLPVRPAASAREAVAGADLVLCATTSATPVLEAGWLAPGAHVNTVGPKTRSAHEVGPDVAARAAVIATDSPAQIQAYGEPFFLDGTPDRARVADLADLDPAAPRAADAVTLFCSAGLAGTEVLVADALLSR